MVDDSDSSEIFAALIGGDLEEPTFHNAAKSRHTTTAIHANIGQGVEDNSKGPAMPGNTEDNKNDEVFQEEEEANFPTMSYLERFKRILEASNARDLVAC